MILIATPELEPSALEQLIKQSKRIRVLELALATMVGWAQAKEREGSPDGMYDVLYEEESA